jgi:hypothetical protein
MLEGTITTLFSACEKPRFPYTNPSIHVRQRSYAR